MPTHNLTVIRHGNHTVVLAGGSHAVLDKEDHDLFAHCTSALVAFDQAAKALPVIPGPAHHALVRECITGLRADASTVAECIAPTSEVVSVVVDESLVASRLRGAANVLELDAIEAARHLLCAIESHSRPVAMLRSDDASVLVS